MFSFWLLGSEDYCSYGYYRVPSDADNKIVHQEERAFRLANNTSFFGLEKGLKFYLDLRGFRPEVIKHNIKFCEELYEHQIIDYLSALLFKWSLGKKKRKLDNEDKIGKYCWVDDIGDKVLQKDW